MFPVFVGRFKKTVETGRFFQHNFQIKKHARWVDFTADGLENCSQHMILDMVHSLFEEFVFVCVFFSGFVASSPQFLVTLEVPPGEILEVPAAHPCPTSPWPWKHQSQRELPPAVARTDLT